MGAYNTRLSLMARAIELASENVASGKGGPFAALIVRHDQVIGSGTNLVTSINDPTAHAEIVAVREACRVLHSFQLFDCDVYASCEPCPMCLAALYWARVRRIYFAGTREDAGRAGFDDSYIYQQLALPIPQRAMPMSQLMRDEALEAFRRWAEKPDNQQY
jgi:guanine deaminase